MNNEYEMLISLIKFRLCHLSSFLFRYSVGLTTSLLTHLIPVVRKKDSLLKYLISLTLHTEKGKRYRTIFMRALKDKQNTKMEGILVKKSKFLQHKKLRQSSAFCRENLWFCPKKGKLYQRSYVNSRRAETKRNYTTSLLQLGYRIFLPTLKKSSIFQNIQQKIKNQIKFSVLSKWFFDFCKKRELESLHLMKKASRIKDFIKIRISYSFHSTSTSSSSWWAHKHPHGLTDFSFLISPTDSVQKNRIVNPQDVFNFQFRFCLFRYPFHCHWRTRRVSWYRRHGYNGLTSALLDFVRFHSFSHHSLDGDVCFFSPCQPDWHQALFSSFHSIRREH